ncbi:patatin-like phospholipase family protein [Zavarzinia aquatilis]|uniref:Patatin n=1 Tax=Zavarzinia aquatilis TaxID=2211142 RepID=A0A317EFH2_9PROT|nr:patatin-like phospholipase family protein [Zavarzinia aquatilis]PWR25036.1 patatin [Zavarzinia aquatilis]
MTGRPDPVAALALARRRAGSRPGARADGQRLALVIEGGGMRGVIAGGMVSALEHLGLTTAFDAVYGTSAGACAGAYLLAGQALPGTRIFYEDINNRRFISLPRLARGRPAMDVDFLVDHVMTAVKPLDTARLIAAAIPLTMMATRVADAAPVPLTGFRDHGEVMRALRATSRVPLLSGPPVPGPDGALLVDGALSAPVPVGIAEREGASHVLVLLTRPTARPAPGGGGALMRRLLVRRLSPAIGAAFAARGERYAALARLLGAARLPGGAALSVVTPGGPGAFVGRMEKRRLALIDGAAAGWRAVMAWAGQAGGVAFPDAAMGKEALR